MADRAPTPFPGPRPDAVTRNKFSPRNGGEPGRRPSSPASTPRHLDDPPGAAAPPPTSVVATPAGAALTFTVLGRPLPAGSKTTVPIIKGGAVVGRRIVETGNREAKAAWRADIRVAAKTAMAGRPPFACPVAMSVRFFLRRPKSHYGTGRNAELVKASSPEHLITMPDVGKLARGLEDSMTGICYVDDSQIVDAHLSKRYGNVERTEVLLVPIETSGGDA